MKVQLNDEYGNEKTPGPNADCEYEYVTMDICFTRKEWEMMEIHHTTPTSLVGELLGSWFATFW